MIRSANDTPIHELFSPERNIKYCIPRYQREYSWKKDQWEDILNDILGEDNTSEGPFLGSIICVNKSTNSFEPILEIIDGQQRLTTLSLLYAAIHSRLKREIKEDDEFKSELINLKYKLVQKKKPKETKLELSYQNSNYEDYLEILEESEILDIIPGRPKHIGNRRLYKAYTFFSTQLEKMDYPKVKELLEKINSSHVIKIEVNTNSDAFNLFESINNRGIPLSAIDLIKNNLLAILEKRGSKKIEDAFEEWKEILDNLTDDPIWQERFLRHYYNAFKYKEKIIKVQIKEGKATKSNLLKIYDQLIERDPLFLLKDLYKKSILFNQFLNPEESNLYYKELRDLLNIGGTPSYIFLLYLMDEFGDKKNLIKETLYFLCKYFVRRNLTDYPATRNLDNIFIALIEWCEKNRENIGIELIKTFLINPERYATDDLFKEKLSSDIYEINSEITRYILCKIEEEHSNKESDDLWKKDQKGNYIFTIEHIFPEGGNIPKEWVEMIAKGNKENASKLQEEYVHKLGNLTLTGYNSNLSNLAFDKKRDRKDKRGVNIGYKNKLYLNSEIYPLSKMNKWTIEDINKRTDLLVKEALKLFN